MNAGIVVDLPGPEYEVHLTHHSARLIKNRRILHEEFFIRPEMQYQALMHIRAAIENIRAASGVAAISS